MRTIILLLSISLFACNGNQDGQAGRDFSNNQPAATPVEWHRVDTIDIDEINADLVPGQPTVDVGIYYPSNFDPAFRKVSLKSMTDGFIAAKDIYSATGVQFRLLWVKTGEVNPAYFSITSSEIPDTPGSEFVNMYEGMRRNPSVLTPGAAEAFEAIIEDDPDNSRTIYLVVLEDVFFPFFEQVEGERNWIVKYVRTSALSFPPYSHVDAIPERLRGIITVSNLTQVPEESSKVIAHEIGHKIINVSHEYKQTDPGHEVWGEGGLMIYGTGLDIPSGKEGRWHLERLLLSPFIYRLDEQGNKVWNPGYIEGGHYYDPLYGDRVVRF